MHFTKSLFVAAACVAAAVAQGLLAFTRVPSSVTPGERVTLGWGGGNSEVSATCTWLSQRLDEQYG